jgi:hypothetical protein
MPLAGSSFDEFLSLFVGEWQRRWINFESFSVLCHLHRGTNYTTAHRSSAVDFKGAASLWGLRVREATQARGPSLNARKFSRVATFAFFIPAKGPGFDLPTFVPSRGSHRKSRTQMTRAMCPATIMPMSSAASPAPNCFRSRCIHSQDALCSFRVNSNALSLPLSMAERRQRETRILEGRS